MIDKGCLIQKAVGKCSTKAREAGPVAIGTATGLPTDIQLQSAQRLGTAALFYAGVYFLAYFVAALPHFILEGFWREVFLSFHSVMAWIAILGSLFFRYMVGCGHFTPRQLLNMGLVYSVLATLGIAFTNQWGILPEYDPVGMSRFSLPGVPWECIWIIMYPMFAPNSPKRILIASLLSATMSPLVVGLSMAAGATSSELPISVLVWRFLFTNYLCALMAYWNSRFIHNLGKTIREARDVGSYQLDEPIGRGGMGEVWRARHRMLARPAAIKLIRPESLDRDPEVSEAVVRRFEREAQATAALQSHHTIELYDFGVTDEGAFYYVMELLNGQDLASLVKRFGPVSAGRTIHFMRQVCHSLAEAHHAGLIHRDIKPANIFTCRSGLEYDFVKVLDFGIVKTGLDGNGEVTQITQDGLATGTPGYIAPEIAIGSVESDGRADLYALGCVGYWLLTGEEVFSGGTPMQVVVQHIQGEVVPPSQRSEMEQIILQCLEKDPNQRPASAEKLDRLLADCEEAATWDSDRARTWFETHLPEVVAGCPAAAATSS